jgi:thiol-disulfide isomerase/thioredoxin
MQTMTSVKVFSVIFILGLIISSCGSKHNLTAEIEGFGNDTLLVDYLPVSQFFEIDKRFKDTIISVNNKFEFDLPIGEAILTTISSKKGSYKRMIGGTYFPRHKNLVLLLKPNEQITVNGKLHDYYLEYEAKGSPFNEEYSRLRSEYIEEMSQAAKIELQLDTLLSENADREQILPLFIQRNELNGMATKQELKFIKSNYDKELAAYFLARPRERYDTIGNYSAFYEKLNSEIKDGIFKNMLDAQHLKYKKLLKVKEAEKNIVVGKTAPDFTLTSISGEEFALSSVKDKIIILDFWGSWCGWCLKGIPQMKNYYEKYKSQIEIVGIACKDSEENWKKSVEENHLEWKHVINHKNSDNDVSVLYGVKSYPTKIILDKDKKTLAKFVGETDSFYEKLDELMNK